MLNISFNLKDPQTGTETAAKKETSIICVICYNGNRLKYYTNEKISPNNWETDKKKGKKYQRVKGIKQAPEFNKRLDKFVETVKTVFWDYQNANNNQLPTTETLKNLLDKANDRSKETAITFMSFFAELIEHSRAGIRRNARNGEQIQPNTIKSYVTVYNHLQGYAAKAKKNVDFENITTDFYVKYVSYLGEQLGLAPNSVGDKDIKIIKMVMGEAVDKGLTKNLEFKSKHFKKPKEPSDKIYLTEFEVKQFEKLDLTNNKRLEQVRDLFIIGCYTGQRFSDFSTFDTTKITYDEKGRQYLPITQKKTGTRVTVPIHPVFKELLQKYNYELPEAISNQNMNEYLKEAGELVECLKAPVSVQMPTKKGKRETVILPKYRLITTHTARRSFATNQYKAGMSPFVIMKLTGHKTQSSFMNYIKQSDLEFAQQAFDYWETRLNEPEKAPLRAVS